MTEQGGTPLTTEPPADTGSDPAFDDPVEGTEDLPDDVANDDLSLGEPPDDPAREPGPVFDTNTDAPVVGTPLEGDIDDPAEGVAPDPTAPSGPDDR